MPKPKRLRQEKSTRWRAAIDKRTIRHRSSDITELSPKPRIYTLPEEQQHQKAEPNETPENDSIPPLLVSNLADEIVHAGNISSSADNAPINVGNRLALDTEVLVDGIRLAQNAVHHAVAVLDSAPLFEHVLGLGGGRVGCAIGADV